MLGGNKEDGISRTYLITKSGVLGRGGFGAVIVLIVEGGRWSI